MTCAAPDIPAPFFWLHIKKSGGGSVRRLLAPDYVQATRVRQPVNFIQSPRSQHNDILNNFRIPLGAYQFRRAQFARTWLYPDCWENMLRFAFLREPVSRCVSAFHYLSKPRGGERSFVQHLRQAGPLPAHPDQAYLFDAFLELVEAAQSADSIYQPVNLHFTTHVAPVHGDVTDADGALLLSHLFRLEDMRGAIDQVLESCGIDRRVGPELPRVNTRAAGGDFTPTPAQRARIRNLYAGDFDLYETT